MRIVVTGFGPFGDFDTNPSTVVVNALSDEATKENCCEDLELVTRLVDVDYAQALKCSEAICADLEADFVVHVGVQPTHGILSLETRAFSDGYIGQDIRGLVPLMNRCEVDGGSCGELVKKLETRIDCEQLRKQLFAAFGEESLPIKIELSKDPGRYLCGYIYYCSLQKAKGRSLFVHIPPFDDKCTPELLTTILKQILIAICTILKQEEEERGKE